MLRDAADRGDDELFVTAVLLQYRPGSDCVEIVNRGHTTPLLLGDGTITPVSCADELPLGLGHLGPAEERGKPTAVALPPGRTVLLYTDGVSEARDATGTFYPLAPRLAALGTTSPDRLVSFLAQDVHEYAGLLADDLAVLALTPDAP
ncbi:PP2C family protein-serine/threonine phosphatase [Kitasatospora sp. NPDC051705]|uniref:PP2C family protein-serine/threonine phosphatase n=1 Tax=Kitasatospora sp. NPDC051705 TaxID=3364057 RepID=UPI0037ADA7B7